MKLIDKINETQESKISSGNWDSTTKIIERLILERVAKPNQWGCVHIIVSSKFMRQKLIDWANEQGITADETFYFMTPYVRLIWGDASPVLGSGDAIGSIDEDGSFIFPTVHS